MDVVTVFKMYKGDLEIETSYLNLVNLLLKQGWKIRYSELSELI